jgi:hypothetical protein
LGIFIDKEIETINKILDKSPRHAIGLISSFSTEAIHRPTKNISLGYAPILYIATQMGIDHLTDLLNKPTDRRYIAHAHTTRVANTYQYWPKEAHEAKQAKLPTLRVLSYLQNITRAEL